jgi:hypothetical protein
MTFLPTATGSGVITMAGSLHKANGGTNSTAAANGGVGYGTGSAHAYTPVGIAGQVLQSAAGAAPIWKTLEMTDIPGAAYKATCRCFDSKYYHAFRVDNRRYCSCCERQSVS